MCVRGIADGRKGTTHLGWDAMCDWMLTYADVSAPGGLPLREGKRGEVSYEGNLPQSPEGGYRTFTSSYNSFSHMGSHLSEPIGKLCRSAFSLILARSFWTGRDVSSADIHGPREPASW